jgi:hypothetical protein
VGDLVLEVCFFASVAVAAAAFRDGAVLLLFFEATVVHFFPSPIFRFFFSSANILATAEAFA